MEGDCGYAKVEYLGPMTGADVPTDRPKAGADGEHVGDDLVPFLGCFTLESSSDFTERFEDWTAPPPDAEAMALGVSDLAEPGDIVVMHIGPETTPDAVAILLADLRAKGQAFLTVEPMLLSGDPVWDNGWPSKQCEDDD